MALRSPGTSPTEVVIDASLENQPLWYKDAVVYQLHVRAFFDSLADGVGDFAGLSQKLDYLQDLGVTAIWLQPFYPSPLKDDGYDIADYTNVNPAYGTLRDFKVFLREAHARGLRVITELVLNHTSDQHPWFQRARREKPGSVLRDFYVWSDTAEKYAEARIIFKDFETSNWSWDPVAKAYYWHRFYSHQPDLNFDNPEVQKALFEVVDYWLEMGVDGLRLDAVPYLVEREGTNCENLPETHQVLRDLRKHIDDRFSNRMLLAEANQWPEDAINYFGEGDECHAAFHFPVMPRLFMAIHMEDRFPVIDILKQTPVIPDNCQWFIFLRNHDELTLEMVTDEERDYMVRVYAHDRQARINLGIRRRLAPLLCNNRRKIELMNGLLFSLPGTPVIYYGDEIGMGDNIYLGDRDALRTPMQWSADRNAGFSRANPQQLYLPVIIDPEYLSESVNVETQRKNPQSLWWWMKRLIALRQHYPAFGRGTLEMLTPDNSKVLAFLRSHEDETVLVVANLSRYVQYVELDLSQHEGRRPIELFGQTKFPPIGTLPYMLTLGPHAFYWFALRRGRASETIAPEDIELPRLSVTTYLDELFRGRPRANLEAALRTWLPRQRWFAGRDKTIQALNVEHVDWSGNADPHQAMALVRVDYVEGEGEEYVLPVGYQTGEAADRLLRDHPTAVIARFVWRESKETGILCDAVWMPAFTLPLLEFIAQNRRYQGDRGETIGWSSPQLQEISESLGDKMSPTLAKVDQANSTIFYDNAAALKLFRRVGPGGHPELELGRFLNERTSFRHLPNVIGSLEYQRGDETFTAAVVQNYITDAVSAWKFSVDSFGRYIDLVMAQPNARAMLELPPRSVDDLAAGDASPEAKELMGGYLEAAGQLGHLTALLHVALASGVDEPDIAPQPFTQFYVRSMYQSSRKLTLQNLQKLRADVEQLPPVVQSVARNVLERERQVMDLFHSLLGRKFHAMRIRCHGDYHLGQLLYNGKDLTVIDLEGDPSRTLSERRIKRSPLYDVAGMMRSFHYAAHRAVQRHGPARITTPENEALLEQAAQFWRLWSASAFLRGYLATSGIADLLPSDRGDFQLLLRAHLLEKALAELGHEAIQRHDLIVLPLTAILELLDQAAE